MQESLLILMSLFLKYNLSKSAIHDILKALQKNLLKRNDSVVLQASYHACKVQYFFALSGDKSNVHALLQVHQSQTTPRHLRTLEVVAVSRFCIPLQVCPILRITQKCVAIIWGSALFAMEIPVMFDI